jgi:hypothetical protein
VVFPNLAGADTNTKLRSGTGHTAPDWNTISTLSINEPVVALGEFYAGEESNLSNPFCLPHLVTG